MPSRSFPLLYLASRSPRRQELLARIGVRFIPLFFRAGTRLDPEVDETPLPGEAADAYVLRLARAKAEHGWRLMRLRRLPCHPVLSADTTLEYAGDIIGKPADAANARAILRRLSGQTHRVLTGVALATGDGEDTPDIATVLDLSQVRFRPLEESEIRRYVASGEAMDKAGAYGIQGMAALFIEHISGSDTGIMGLPLCATGELLKGARKGVRGQKKHTGH
ncbi:MAG: Maf family protein [Zoogloeaceae bacterium]|nr:Maf family protein [Zoogloeaceae bacterium]